LQVEHPARARVALGRGITAFTAPHCLQSAPCGGELSLALLEKGLARQVADRLALQARAAGGEGRGQRQVGVLRLLRELVVRQMIGAIGVKVAAGRGAGEPLAQKIVHLAVGMEQAVRAFVHQNGKAQLPTAQNSQRHRCCDEAGNPAPLPCCRCAKSGECHDCPRMHNQPDPAPGRDRRDAHPFFRPEYLAGIGGLYRGHGNSPILMRRS